MQFKTIKPPYNYQTLMAGGVTNDLFLVNNQYFMKKSQTICDKFLDYQNQTQVVSKVQWQKFTLPILETQIINGHLITIMPYYHNLLTLNEHKIYDGLLEQLSSLVQQLHQIPINNKEISRWNSIEQLKVYSNLVPSLNDKLTTITNEISNWLTNYQPKKVVLCHNDLSANNFVKHQNRWFLIDWDFACLNDPLFDVASFASETLTNKNDIKKWFSYFNLTNAEIIIVKKWMTYQNIIWYYWASYLYQETNLETFKNISNSKLEALLKNN